jgi:hypothetical protein
MADRGNPATAAAAAALVSCVAAPASGSPMLVLASGFALSVTVLLLWRPGQVPVLLLPAVYQWSQVAVRPIQSAISGVAASSFSTYGETLDGAALFGLAAIVSLAVGMRMGSGARRGAGLPDPARSTQGWPQRNVMLLCFGAMAAGHALTAASRFAGPARQILSGLGSINLAGLFLLAYWCLVMRKAYAYLALALVFEIVVGMTGFFADFRGAILAAFLALIAARPRLRLGGVVLTTAVVAAAIFIASFWSIVKVEYRPFLNGGTGAQVVVQPLENRLEYLAHAAGTITGTELSEGFGRLVDRQSYIDYLALTLERVPLVLPHEHGARLAATATHVLTPRIFFPNKPPTPNDTDVTAYYTGLPFNLGDTNTSISIGYLGELYIDFGFFGALAACLLLGVGVGRAFSFIRDWPGAPISVNYALAVMFAVPLCAFETALIKLVGGVLMSLAAAIAIQRFLVPAVLRRLRIADRSEEAPVGAAARRRHASLARR